MSRASSTSSISRDIPVGNRTLMVEQAGAPDGTPVFLLHGTPGSRSGPRPRNSVLYLLGVRLISYDRPGYGGSRRHPGRTVADTADDVRIIAKELGIDRFAVVGRSAGGPHALACAALLPDLVARTGALVSLAPPKAPGLDWYLGMAEGNVKDYQAADSDPSILAQRLRSRAKRALSNDEGLLDMLREEMRDSDRRFIDDVAIRRLLTATHTEALRDGAAGWLDDLRALRMDWGFEPKEITGEVWLWHGEDDNFAPASHTRWLADQIRGARLTVESGTAHFGAIEFLPQMFSWLTAWESTAPSRADDALSTRTPVTKRSTRATAGRSVRTGADR